MGVREQMCASRIGYSGLQVGLPGMSARVCGGLLCQRTDLEHTGGDRHRVAGIETARPPEGRCAPGRSRRPGPVDQARSSAACVLVGDQRAEAAVGDVLGEAVQPGE